LLRPDEVVEIGQVEKKHGFRGGFKMLCDADLQPVADRVHWLFLYFDLKPVPFGVARLQCLNEERALVQLRGVDSEAALAPLLKRAVGLHQNLARELSVSIRPEENWVGYAVVDAQTQVPIGTIAEVDVQRLQALATVETPEGQRLAVPLADELIQAVDSDAQRLEMHLPSGLRDV
jgi:16S rRNA processing protein RimM